MNHESRIKQLEKRIDELEDLIKELVKEKGKWIKLSEASQYGVSPAVIRRKIKGGDFAHLKDWRMNGNRYFVNVNSIKKII